MEPYTDPTELQRYVNGLRKASLPGRVEDWRGNPLGKLLSVSGVSSFVPE